MHWRRKWQPTPVFLPGESQGRGSLVGCCLWDRTELDTAEATQQQQQQDLFVLPVTSALLKCATGGSDKSGSKNLPATRETWVQSLGAEDPLEKEMATHNSILVWRISWTEEPGGLQSLGLQRARHG